MKALFYFLHFFALDGDSDDPDYVYPTETRKEDHSTVQTRSHGLKFLVESVGDELEWIVPSLPVLTIIYVQVNVIIDSEQISGLINQKDFHTLQGKEFPCKGICHSHCTIFINATEYAVLWTWELFQELIDDQESDSDGSSLISCISETDLSDSDISIGDVNLGDDDDTSDCESDSGDISPVHHTLPFKVMGVAHTNQSQTHLGRASIKIYDEHEEVTAHLLPERDNERDADAISVQINYGDGPCHVGYIPRELTNFIHPLLKDNAITKVEIGHIMFSVKWCRPGFYMNLLITRLGRWDPYVTSKALRVK